MHQQAAIYDAYVKRTTANNVEPVEHLSGSDVWAVLKAQGVDFHKPYDFTTRYWDNDSRTRVFKFDDGRVAEYGTTNTAFRSPLLAIFANHEDWFSYRRPMGRFHYFNT